MQKAFQIELQLFFAIYDYFFNNPDGQPQGYEADEIRRKLDEKLDKVISRELFSKYKRAATAEEREQARQQYLDHVGMLHSHRTPTEIHKNEL